jgi:hypothetical protein
MYTKILKVFGALAVVAILAFGFLALSQPGSVYASGLDRGGPGGRGGANQGAGVTGSGVVSVTPLSSAEKDALSQAILEEYGAYNLYTNVISQLGNVYPFSQIVRAEQQHINALSRQAVKYGVAIPANPGLTNAPSFSTLAEACQAGADAEIADAALYGQLKPDVTHSDILQVFNNLQNASLTSHLPLFEACK